MTKKPTPADINKCNAEFWEEQSRLFEKRIAKRPHDLEHVVDKTNERIDDGALKKVRSLEAQMEELDALRGADQSVRASGPRTRKRAHREIVIEAMRPATHTSQLDDFLDAAATGSIDGIEIIPPGPRDGGKYVVRCDELDSDSRFSYSTIGGWWTDAKKS